MNFPGFPLLMFLLSIWRKVLELNPILLKLLFIPGLEKLRWIIGYRKAQWQFIKAYRNLPAYRDFIGKHSPNEWKAIPVIDKVNYINRYPLEKRCLHGQLPEKGVIFDESSGSSGQPTNWARGAAERNINRKMIQMSFLHQLGHGPHFIINAFALGPWATGVNVSMAFSGFCRLKSLGPDIQKIRNTLLHFGTGHAYTIMGYPPFLKQLIDMAGIPWENYQVNLIFGGEPISESTRAYLLSRGIKKVYGSLGASDLELNLAAENDFTIWLRQLLIRDPKLHRHLFPTLHNIPMIFQYNPLDFFLESNARQELLVTLCRPQYLCPKIRYNIHDTGIIIRYPLLKQYLAKFGHTIPPELLSRPELPVLFHFGRSDQTVSFYGSKISPADVRETIDRVPGLAAGINSFMLHTWEDQQHNKHLCFHLELTGKQQFSIGGLNKIQILFMEQLRLINQDYAAACSFCPPDNQPELQLHPPGSGPFAENDIRIKYKYVQEEGIRRHE